MRKNTIIVRSASKGRQAAGLQIPGMPEHAVWGFGHYFFLLAAFFFVVADYLNSYHQCALWCGATSAALCLAVTAQCLWNLSDRRGWFSAAGTGFFALLLPHGCNYLTVGALTASYFSLLNGMGSRLTLADLMKNWGGCAVVLLLACSSHPQLTQAELWWLAPALAAPPALQIGSAAFFRLGRCADGPISSKAL